MNIILQLIIVILGILILSSLLGYLIGKLMFRRFIKKLDKKINIPDNVQKINKLLDEQEMVSIKREVDQNDRRNRIERELELEAIRRKSGIKEPTEQSISEGRDERRIELQNSDTNKTGKPESRDEGFTRNSEEDWADFS